MITIAYANAEYWGRPPTFSVSLTAVAGQTVVLFDAECDPAIAPLRADTIQVLP